MARYKLSNVFRGEAGLIAKGDDASVLIGRIGAPLIEADYDAHTGLSYGCFQFMFDAGKRFDYASCRGRGDRFDFPDFIDNDIDFTPRATFESLHIALSKLGLETMLDRSLEASEHIKFVSGVVYFSKLSPEEPFDSVTFYGM